MIKFFRHIRRSVISEGKTKKYLLYAIGEIILVVIGILIALQINNWNEDKKNSKQEKEILSQLLSEYESNFKQIETKISLRNGMMKSCFTLLNYIQNRRENLSVDSIDYHLSNILLRPTFDPQLGVSNELINSGKLYLLKNSTLRNRLSSYSSFLEELKEEEDVLLQITEEQFFPFLIKHYQIGGISKQFLFDDNLRSKLIIGDKLGDFSEIKKYFKSDGNFDTLLAHPDFEDEVIRILGLTPYTNEQAIGVKDKTAEIIQLIKSEKKKDQ
ncbi:DUF6090 family protein [Psychroserpens sp. AS72]|uniref:DUF6090 family protein n=1 Tax=Psychroserpens sp. AS72 TaxID=3135775 RepID=UPI003174D761